MMGLLARLEKLSRSALKLAGLALLALIGLIDYVTGYEMFFSVFYLLAVGLAAWFVGRGFGLLLSVLSVAVWIGGDLAAGAQYSSSLIPIWNAVILMVFYFIVVWLMTSLRSLHRDLEARVQERTLALRREMAERERLEEEILKISEREQRRIGHDLHDSLCQHLTGTALAGQVLQERLAAKSLPESDDASKIVDLVEEGITLARNLAHGLYPVQMEAEGLMAAFEELARKLTETAKLQCSFECETPVLIHNDEAATHLYRIAQEAVSNAIRHGKAKQILISLCEQAGRVLLTIEDDGVGLPETNPKTDGLGIRIMAHRAAMMQGTLSVEPALTGGTVVICSIPRLPTTNDSDDKNHHAR
ncbi:MAG: sensor histidine kinase [Verrucomicrobiota bacterium]